MLMLIKNNIFRRRSQSLLTIAITMLTVMVAVMVLGLLLVMNRGLELSRERLGADAVLMPKYAPVDPGELLFTAVPEKYYMKKDVYEAAKKLKGMKSLSPQFYAQTLALSCCDTGEEARIIGFDPETDFILKPYLAEEGKLKLADDELIVGSNFRDKDLLGRNYMILGRTFRVIKVLLPTGTGMDSTVFMNIDVARELSLESEVIAKDWQGKDPKDHISVIMVKLADGIDPEDFQKYIERSGLDAKCILTGNTISSMAEQMSISEKVMLALCAATLAVAALSLFGRFSALAKDRRKEIGLLRSMGVRKSQVFGLIIGEASTMAFIGGIIGSIIGLISMNPVIDTLKDAFRLSPSVWTYELAFKCGLAGVLLALLLGFISAIIPAAKSASLDPQTAITQGEV